MFGTHFSVFYSNFSGYFFEISKDQNGAYGTANNYGDGFISKLLKYIVKNSSKSKGF